MTNWIIAGAVIVVLALGGLFLIQGNDTKDDAMMEDKAMMEKKEDAMKKDEGAMEMKGDTMMKEDAMEKDAMMKKSGSYETYSAEKLALANSGKVVLFFHAPWCPTCKALNSDITARASSIPDGVHILKVDYDSSAALKQKYGVTYQHTLVQVDASGNQITKWSGGLVLADLLARIK